MKPVYTLVAVLFLIASCKKEVQEKSSTDLLQIVKASLADSLDKTDYQALDFKRAVINKIDTAGLYFMRVPFKAKAIGESFVIVKTKRDGSILAGKIIQLDGGVAYVGNGPVKQREWEGNISISSLNRKSLIHSPIHNGFIEAFRNSLNAREETKEPDPMPEVVIVTYVNHTIDYSTILWLDGFFYTGGFSDSGMGGNGGGSYYGSTDGGGGYTGGGGDNSGNNAEDETIYLDIDTYAEHPGIDVESYLKCFDAISDVGAQCEVGIYADIPVDKDPNKIFDFSTGSPGHTFIQIKKVSADGSKSIVQNIGFYPKTGWKSGLTSAPIEAKFVDDGSHEFNAGYTKSLTPDEFKSTLTEIRYLRNMQYDIDNYNCTDWALAVFNKQGYGLDIPLYDIPGNVTSVGTSMPQGVYNKLMEMKSNNDVHADKIQIGFYKGYVTSSDGPCN